MKKILNYVDVIADMRLRRPVADLPLRILKLNEEAGESSGAIVSVVTDSYKKLTYEDVIEEIIDTWIVATDAMLYEIPGTEHMTTEERNDYISNIIEIKLNKWKEKMNNHQDNS